MRRCFGVGLPPEPYPREVFPGSLAPIVWRQAHGHNRCELARFGLVPHWIPDATAAQRIGRRTYNARSETVAVKPSYRQAWRRRQFAIALLDAFYEPHWERGRERGRAQPWRIQRADGEPMGVAALWERWMDRATGEIVQSFTLLTVNAEGHPVMRRLHRAEDEKRSVVVLDPPAYGTWLSADHTAARALLRCPAPQLLQAQPAGPSAQAAPAGLFD